MTAGAHLLVSVTRSADYEDMDLPTYQSDGAAGMDLLAAVNGSVVIEPGERMTIRTGISIAIPDGHEAQIRPRSGPAAERGVTVLNAPGTVDSDYRGEVKVLLANLGAMPFVVGRGMRIAQLVVARVERVRWDEREVLPDTFRSDSGFGSTGLSATFVEDVD